MRRRPYRELVVCDGSGWIDVGDQMRNERCLGCVKCGAVTFKKKRELVGVLQPKPKPKKIKVKLKKLSKGDIKRIHEALQRSLREEEEKRDDPPKGEEGTCVVCKGTVKGKYMQESTHPFDMIPLGPASSDYYVWSFKGYHCTGCGLKYEFLPPQSSTAWP